MRDRIHELRDLHARTLTALDKAWAMCGDHLNAGTGGVSPGYARTVQKEMHEAAEALLGADALLATVLDEELAALREERDRLRDECRQRAKTASEVAETLERLDSATPNLMTAIHMNALALKSPPIPADVRAWMDAARAEALAEEADR